MKGTGYASMLWQQIVSKQWKFTVPIYILHTKHIQGKTRNNPAQLLVKQEAMTFEIIGWAK
jgi:hypothetical protein